MQYSHSNSSLECFCGHRYFDPVDLEEHRTARGHFPLHRCGIHCEHPVNPSRSQAYSCGGCSKVCENLNILNDHHIATGHCFCSKCDLHFENQDSFTTHGKTVIHPSEFKCCDCNISFKDDHALVAHMKKYIHRKPSQAKTSKTTKKSKTENKDTPALAKGYVCNECRRDFQSAQSLQQHRESVKHKPLSALSCPMGRNCRASFSSPSALLHHLESGSCPSGINRDEIYKIIQSCDEDGIIHKRLTLTPSTSYTSPSNDSSSGSDAWMLSSDTSSEWSLLTPSLSEGSVEDSLDQWSLPEHSQLSFERNLSMQATAIPKLKCPLCPKKRKIFANALDLQQHMDSPVHNAKLYHCPTNLVPASSSKKGGKKKHFSTLSGLSQHLESGACRGGKRTFLLCVDIIQGRLEQLGLGGTRVLLSGAMKREKTGSC